MNRVKWQWDENPMLPFLIFFAFGLYCGKAFSLSAMLLVLLSFAVFWTAGYFFGQKIPVLPSVLRTALAACLIWIAGAGLRVFRSESVELPEHSAFQGIVTEPGPLQENGSRRCLARILRIRKKNLVWEDAKGQAVIWFRGQAAAGFRSGHTFLASMPLRGIPAPAIPGEFNTRAWYQNQGVYWQTYLHDRQFRLLSNPPPLSIRNAAIYMRTQMEMIFKKYLPENGDAAMMAALLLGIRSKMEPELKEAYSAAGLTHILAVSGMHVALIYGFLSLLLAGLHKFKYGRILFSLGITLLLWFYALITGLSPSVLRAVCLFSIMQFSDVLRRPSLPINNLCFASILLLMADDKLLYDLGYQLSFAAVFGILSFQSLFSSFWQPRNKILRMMYENLCVTMSASITTLPLILLHFHRFPLYFLFSNLLAVPFSNLLIYGGIALILCSPFSGLGKLAGFLLHHAIFILNAFVCFVNSLPFSSLNHLYPSIWICCLLLPVMIFLQVWLHYRKLAYLNLVLASLLLIFLIQFSHRITEENKPELFAIRYKKSWMILEKLGEKGRIWNLIPQEKSPDFLQAGFRLKSLEAMDPAEKRISVNQNRERCSRIMQVKGNSLLVLNHYMTGIPPSKPVKIETLLLQNAGEKSLMQALKFVQPEEIWLDWNEEKCRLFRETNPQLPFISNFRREKLRQIRCSGEMAPAESDPESGDSRTS